MSHNYRLIVSCPDRVGIVSRVSGFIAAQNGSIVEANQHSDLDTGRFFMRYDIQSNALSADAFRASFAPIADEFEMDWRLSDSARRPRVVIMVSRESHCLVDLLYRWSAGELDCDIPCVISNHEDLRPLAAWHGIPFHHVPVDPRDKGPAFARTERLIEEAEADSVVLARYMQILSGDFLDLAVVAARRTPHGGKRVLDSEAGGSHIIGGIGFIADSGLRDGRNGAQPAIASGWLKMSGCARKARWVARRKAAPGYKLGAPHEPDKFTLAG